MMLNGIVQALGQLLTTDGALMVQICCMLGMLWSGRSFPCRLPRAITRASANQLNRLC